LLLLRVAVVVVGFCDGGFVDVVINSVVVDCIGVVFLIIGRIVDCFLLV